MESSSSYYINININKKVLSQKEEENSKFYNYCLSKNYLILDLSRQVSSVKSKIDTFNRPFRSANFAESAMEALYSTSLVNQEVSHDSLFPRNSSHITEEAVYTKFSHNKGYFSVMIGRFNSDPDIGNKKVIVLLSLHKLKSIGEASVNSSETWKFFLKLTFVGSIFQHEDEELLSRICNYLSNSPLVREDLLLRMENGLLLTETWERLVYFSHPQNESLWNEAWRFSQEERKSLHTCKCALRDIN